MSRPSGVDLIAAERARQLAPTSVGGEGWDADHDAGQGGQLALAAACYALPEERRSLATDLIGSAGNVHVTVEVALWGVLWPWRERWWKPSQDRIRDLTKAGALIAAAIDALQQEDSSAT